MAFVCSHCGFRMPPCENLTPAERVAVALLFQGVDYDGIAERLGIRHHAVKMRLHRCYRKLGVKDALELVTTAYRQGGFWLWAWEGETVPRRHFDLRCGSAPGGGGAEVIVNAKYKAFLDLIAWSEGTSTHPLTANDGYDVIVTGTNGPAVFTDYSKHPFENGGYVTVREGPPPLNSTAAGRYQLLARFWRIYKAQMGLTDYSAEAQDRVALQQVRERGALLDIDAGEIALAIGLCSNIWASFPGNNYMQGGHKIEVLLAKYGEFLSGGSERP